MSVYDVGQAIEIYTVIANSGGTLVDPGALSIVIERPAQVGTIYEYPASIVREAIGSYYYNAVLDTPGYWLYRWVGSAPSVVDEARIFVRYPEAGTV